MGPFSFRWTHFLRPRLQSAIFSATATDPRARVSSEAEAAGVPRVGGALSEELDLPAAEDVRALWRAGRIEEARLALVRATEGSVYRFLKGMVRDEDLAQDLAQDTFVRAFQSLGSFRGEARLSTWILAIARNLAVNRARRARLEKRWVAPLDDSPDVADPRGSFDVAEPRLVAALAGLPLAQREAVLLYYGEDLGIDDVARLTGRPANTIKSDLHRARATLRAALDAPGGSAAGAPLDREEEP